MPVSDVHFPIALDIVGVVVGSVQGAFFARMQTRVSVIGVAVFAFVTALGGAMIRDGLMAQPSAALSTAYLIAWGGATAAALVIWYFEHRLAALLTVLDALYLGVWAVAGADKAIHLGFGTPAVVLLGVITAVGGGLIRDLLAGQVPAIFQGGALYTTAALIGAAVFAALHESVLPRPVDALVAIAPAVSCRLLSLRLGWSMPLISPRLDRANVAPAAPAAARGDERVDPERAGGRGAHSPPLNASNVPAEGRSGPLTPVLLPRSDLRQIAVCRPPRAGGRFAACVRPSPSGEAC